jgi:hypothetical protein
MDLFFEIIQRALHIPANEILLPDPTETHGTMRFWQKVIQRNQQRNESRFYDVEFQFYMYMTWSCTRLYPKLTPNLFRNDEDADEDEDEKNAPMKKGWAFVKFNQFFQTVDNMFFSSDFQEKMLKTFSKAQRTYHALARFARSWKVRHVRCTVDHDFTMTPIDRSKKQLFCSVYQNGAVYLFRVSEVLHIVETALCQCNNFFVDSHLPKNPYTNEPFSKAILMLMYDRVRRSDYKMPILFELFYRCYFDLEEFILQHDAVIRERHIERIIQYGDVEVLTYHIRKMLKYMRVFPSIDSHFPPAQLVRIFRPYLHLYLCHFFSTVYGEKKETAYNLLKRQLTFLSAYNPRLGQRVLVARKDLDCPLNREKLKDRYVMVASSAAAHAAADMVEVFSINHVACHRLRTLPHQQLQEEPQSIFYNHLGVEFDEDEEDEFDE